MISLIKDSLLPHAAVAVIADDDMVHKFHADHHAGLIHPPGDNDVLLAGRGITAGMVMEQDDRALTVPLEISVSPISRDFVFRSSSFMVSCF